MARRESGHARLGSRGEKIGFMPSSSTTVSSTTVSSTTVSSTVILSTQCFYFYLSSKSYPTQIYLQYNVL